LILMTRMVTIKPSDSDDTYGDDKTV
jgi:hypothetical protein